ncbi:hypothetical protein J6590_091317 [Homalodisca vitripennis]|nr:hypothetical protein J6590_091317 [Homalodisca vitripennis]
MVLRRKKDRHICLKDGSIQARLPLLQYKHYSGHSPEQWNVPKGRGGSEHSAQLRKKNIQPPLQTNRSHSVSPRSFIGTKRVNRLLELSESPCTALHTIDISAEFLPG